MATIVLPLLGFFSECLNNQGEAQSDNIRPPYARITGASLSGNCRNVVGEDDENLEYMIERNSRVHDRARRRLPSFIRAAMYNLGRRERALACSSAPFSRLYLHVTFLVRIRPTYRRNSNATGKNMGSHPRKGGHSGWEGIQGMSGWEGVRVDPRHSQISSHSGTRSLPAPLLPSCGRRAIERGHSFVGALCSRRKAKKGVCICSLDYGRSCGDCESTISSGQINLLHTLCFPGTVD